MESLEDNESFDQSLMKSNESTAKPKRRRKIKAETAAMAGKSQHTRSLHVILTFVILESTSTRKNDTSTKAAVDTMGLKISFSPMANV